MLINQTLQKLHSMRLTGWPRRSPSNSKTPTPPVLSFEERIGWLIDRHWIWRENQAQDRRLKTPVSRTARLASRTSTTVLPEDWIDPSSVHLATCDWVTRHHNLILLGPCGVGKTFLACAFAQQAIRQGHTAFYTRQPQLFRELSMARADGTLHNGWQSWPVSISSSSTTSP